MAPSTDRSQHRELPQPPFTDELLADYHADLLTPRLRRHIRDRLPADPRAREVLAALEEVRGQLAGLTLQPEAPPDYLRLRTEATLDRIAADVAEGR